MILFSICITDQGMHLINFKITHVFMNGIPNSHRECVLSALLRSSSLSPASANTSKCIQAVYITWNSQWLVGSLQRMENQKSFNHLPSAFQIKYTMF